MTDREQLDALWRWMEFADGVPAPAMYESLVKQRRAHAEKKLDDPWPELPHTLNDFVAALKRLDIAGRVVRVGEVWLRVLPKVERKEEVRQAELFI